MLRRPFFRRQNINANTLKIIACVSMLVDHMGVILFPSQIIFRCIGRLALPIFAFFIAEGVKHTSNKLKYLLRVFILGIICQAGYTLSEVIEGSKITGIYFNILLTFSVGILICYCWQAALKNKKGFILLLVIVLLAAALQVYSRFSYTLGFGIEFDYGFMGMMLPLCAMIFEEKRYQFILFGVGLVLLSIQNIDNWTQWLGLLSLPLLWLYNNERGKYKLKYLFYIFYPAHLVVLYGISYLI